jgi:hypothetical protein
MGRWMGQQRWSEMGASQKRAKKSRITNRSEDARPKANQIGSDQIGGGLQGGEEVGQMEGEREQKPKESEAEDGPILLPKTCEEEEGGGEEEEEEEEAFCTCVSLGLPWNQTEAEKQGRKELPEDDDEEEEEEDRSDASKSPTKMLRSHLSGQKRTSCSILAKAKHLLQMGVGILNPLI